MPSISVIVPVYKVEAYLGRCVESILSQTFSDFELILVDDGSPDCCGRLCDGYARQDSRIHVIHQQNGGLSAARNAGIDWAMANSDSQFLAFVDSDDWVAPEYLALLHRAAAETGCSVSICGFARTEGEPLPAPGESAAQVMSGGDYYCSDTVHGGVTVVAWNKLYRKELFDAVRYPVGKLHEDEFVTYRLLYAAGQVAVIASPLYAYFQNPVGIMQSKWNPRRMHALEAMEQQLRFAKEEGYPQLGRKAAERYVFNVCDQLGLAQEPEHRKLLRSKLRFGLKTAREWGLFPLSREKQWVYELAYPMKPVWWLASRLRALRG